MGKRRLKRRKRGIPKKIKGCLVVVAVFVLVFILVAAPIVLDCLYGKGVLRGIWENSFPAEAWFSFIGSYFPATIIGILSLCQAYIIYRQDSQYKAVMRRHCFHLIKHANIYRCEDGDKRIGRYTFPEVKRMLERKGRASLTKVWEECMIVEFDLYSSTDIEISEVQAEELEWEIAGKLYRQDDQGQMMAAVTRTARSQQQISLLFRFDEFEKVRDPISKCFLNEYRRNIDYKTSEFTVVLKVIDEENDECELELEFQLESTKDNYQMESIEEHCYCEVRK